MADINKAQRGPDDIDLVEEYPEHIKLLAVVDQSQAIGEFIENSGYLLAKVDDFGNLYTESKSVTDVLAEYFGIEMARIDKEKRAMIAALRGEEG